MQATQEKSFTPPKKRWVELSAFAQDLWAHPAKYQKLLLTASVTSTLVLGTVAIAAGVSISNLKGEVATLTQLVESQRVALQNLNTQLTALTPQVKRLSQDALVVKHQVEAVSEEAANASIQAADASEQAAVLSEAEAGYKRTAQALQTTPSMIPVVGGYQSTPFDSHRVQAGVGESDTMHNGINLASAHGSSVLSSADGIVTFVGDREGYGNCIIISHNEQFQTLYGNLSAINVKTEQKVTKGKAIGRVGSSASSKGNYLHYEVIKDGVAIDPTPYLMPETALAQLQR